MRTLTPSLANPTVFESANMTELADRQCIPCRGGVPPLDAEAMRPLLAQVQDWTAVENHHLVKRYRLDDFAQALALVNRIGAVAEEQNHHPDIYLAWGSVEVRIWTHAINGLTENDFVFAAKCDRIFAEMNRSLSQTDAAPG